MPRFDPTINMGHVLIAVGMLGSVAVAYADTRSAIEAHASEIAANKEAIRESKDFQNRVMEMLIGIREDVAALKTAGGR